MEIFDILSNYFTVFQAACIAILITVIGYLYSGKWKKAFNSRYGVIAAALLTVGMLYAYIYPPVRIKRNMYSNWHIILIVLSVVIVSVMLFRINNVTPLFKYLTKGQNVVSAESKRRKLIYRLLSPYERVQLVLADARRTLDSDPYKTYKLLKTQKTDSWKEKDKDAFDKLIAASLFYLGSIKAAKKQAEKLYEKNPEDGLICSILCTIYSQTGKAVKSKKMAEQAYQTMIAAPENTDYSRAQVYNNYACALILDQRTDSGLDIAKVGMKTAIKEKEMSMLHLAVVNYLKLLLRYKNDSTLIEDVLKEYSDALGKPENTCIEYINCQLMLIHNGYAKNNLEAYIDTIYQANVPGMQGEEKCFFCLSCIDIAWSHGINVKNYLDDLSEILKYESRELKLISKIRFYHRLMFFVLRYPTHCSTNGFSIDERYGIIKELVTSYMENEAVSNIEKALSETDSVCVNLKCELRRIMIDVKRQLGSCDFNEIMEMHHNVYREYEAEGAILQMLDVVLQEIAECICEIQSLGAPFGFMEVITNSRAIAVKGKLLELNQAAESLLDQIDTELKNGDFYIRVAKGYCIGGDTENARRCLEQYRLCDCPETWLTEWTKSDYQTIQAILGEPCEIYRK